MPYGEQDMLLQEHYKNLMSDEGEMIGISCDCFNEADIVFSLILNQRSFPLVGNLSSDSEQVGRILDKPE